MSTTSNGFGLAAHELTVGTTEILRPLESWADQAADDATAKKLAGLFRKSFEAYASGASAEVKAAAPGS